ncbi:tail fiber domain-containing protein [Zooshikella marina]|uniref:phage tail-collar fiber domain-containing protein n=1 Tax=Zooshikella ganghwensis TaxID=202772 RepID=UPI001BAF5488|nr:phage tail protein [Zooshikella ganghwensis]MBU2707550.1 tail fiber domain-containing protein [Zooshikella ganghwensis]
MGNILKPVITRQGISALIHSNSRGLQAEISHVAVGNAHGDGNKAKDNAVNTATQLVNEMVRCEVSGGQIIGDHQNQLHLTATIKSEEQIDIYEVGFYLKTGELFAIYASESKLVQTIAGGEFQMIFDLVLTATDGDFININCSDNATCCAAKIDFDYILQGRNSIKIHTQFDFDKVFNLGPDTCLPENSTIVLSPIEGTYNPDAKGKYCIITDIINSFSQSAQTGKTTCSLDNHSFKDGDTIIITQSNCYDGIYTISGVDSAKFDIDSPFKKNGTGRAGLYTPTQINSFTDSVQHPGIQTTCTVDEHHLPENTSIAIITDDNEHYSGYYLISSITESGFDINKPFLKGDLKYGAWGGKGDEPQHTFNARPAYILKNSVTIPSNVSIIGFNAADTVVVKNHGDIHFRTNGTKENPVHSINLMGWSFDGRGGEGTFWGNVFGGTLKNTNNGGAFFLKGCIYSKFNLNIINHNSGQSGGALYSVDSGVIEAKSIYYCKAIVAGGIYGGEVISGKVVACFDDKGYGAINCKASNLSLIECNAKGCTGTIITNNTKYQDIIVENDVEARHFIGNGSKLTDINADHITYGKLKSDHLVDLDASKTSTGVFSDERIPNIDANKTNRGRFSIDRIPDLDASKTTMGTFAIDRIPNLDAEKLVSGKINNTILKNSYLQVYNSKLNLFVGEGVGFTNINGKQNTALGINSFMKNENGNLNVAVGHAAALDNETGHANTAVGNQSLQLNKHGSSNCAIGNFSLYQNTDSKNTAIGDLSLYKNTSGHNNVAAGFEALRNNSSGSNNTAIGFQTLLSNQESHNTAVGYLSLSSNTKGKYNTAIGNVSLKNNTTGINNTAVGCESLENNTTGENNSAVGDQALWKNETGNRNVAVGKNSLQNNKTGSENVAIGYGALESNDQLSDNIAIGARSLHSYKQYYNLNKGGLTAVGYESLKTLNLGFFHTAFGYKALSSTNNASCCTAVGYLSLLENTTGNYNTALGSSTLVTNTTGSNNTAIGTFALEKNNFDPNFTDDDSSTTGNLSGNNNTAIGSYSLQQNTVGFNNVSVGCESLKNNNNGYKNTALGMAAAEHNIDGKLNTALGNASLHENKHGNANTAVGNTALYENKGNYNTAVGDNSLRKNITGENNTALGASALYSNKGFSNCTGVGYNAQVDGSNQIQLGDSYVNVYTHNSLHHRSDKRDKTEIRTTKLGLDFILELRPVDFKFDFRDDYKIYEEIEKVVETGEMDDEGNKITKTIKEKKVKYLPKDGSKKRERFHHGFIAQDVGQLSEDFGGYQDHTVKGGKDVVTLGYSEFIAPIVKAIQEQQSIINAQYVELKKLKEYVSNFTKKV